MKIILASKSPRRKEILENLKIDFKVLSADADESTDIAEPKALVKELALRKAEAVKNLLIKNRQYSDDTVIIGCDTVVYSNGKILGKPKDRKDAFQMLKELSGKCHTVTSGIALVKKDKTLIDSETTTVFFDDITDGEIEEYVATGESDDKAGAYGIQGLASKFIKGIEGCYFNVVGLPVNLLHKMLKKF